MCICVVVLLVYREGKRLKQLGVVFLGDKTAKTIPELYKICVEMP